MVSNYVILEHFGHQEVITLTRDVDIETINRGEMNAFSFDVKTVQYLHLTSSPRLNIHNALRKFNCEQVNYVQKWGARKLVLSMC